MKWQIHKVLRNKYKRALFILFSMFCIGIILTLQVSQFVDKGKKITTSNPQSGNSQDEFTSFTYTEQLETKLATQLQKIDGVGQVEVMITLKSNGELVLNKDQPGRTAESREENGQGNSSESYETEEDMVTTILRNSDGSESPLIVKEIVPEVSGVLIIAEGGDNVLIKSYLIQVAKVLLDLPANKIEIMKMVSN